MQAAHLLGRGLELLPTRRTRSACQSAPQAKQPPTRARRTSPKRSGVSAPRNVPGRGSKVQQLNLMAPIFWYFSADGDGLGQAFVSVIISCLCIAYLSWSLFRAPVL